MWQGNQRSLLNTRIKQAIIKRRYDIYPVGEHSFVQNLFSMSLEPPTTPLLGVGGRSPSELRINRLGEGRPSYMTILLGARWVKGQETSGIIGSLEST